MSDSGVRFLLEEAVQQLATAGISNSSQEARWLLAELVGCRIPDLWLLEEPIGRDVVRRFQTLVAARTRRQPLQYLLGSTDFLGRRVRLAAGVFIPRPETEAIAVAAQRFLKARQAVVQRTLDVLELGTGSGCLSISVASCVSACVVVAVELSWGALRVAQENLRAHHLIDRVRLVQGDWASAIRGSFDLVLANPPYVSTAAVGTLPPEVRCEPSLSLDGGRDGVSALRLLVRESPRLLKVGGALCVECAEDQVVELIREARAGGWVGEAVALYDLAGRPRGILASRVNSDTRSCLSC